mmetsp:Transcript_9627/g.35687  ORF Transcript_9627/g.35687 Transcript_9627/m.35687 type:complete len:823 (-) Transcript_9627:82-2550(-)
MVVIGIDLGGLSCTVSHVGRGQVKILLNEASQRQTPSLVGFTDECRVIGAAAEQNLSFNSANTVASVTRFLGLRYSQIAKDDLDTLTCKYSKSDDDELLFHVNYLGEQRIFNSVQIMGMLLDRLKEIAEKETGLKGVDAVVSVPAYYIDAQHRALASAARIAGITLLKIIPSTTAAAIEYGLYKENLPKKDEKPINVAFVDVGHTDTVVSIVTITETKVKVISTAFDKLLGGRNFGRILFEHFADEILRTKNLDVRSDQKASNRLHSAAEKIKKILSANAVAKTFVECIMNDTDVSLEIERDTFDQMASTLKARFEVPVKKALEDSGLSPADITSVEVLGGSTYMPAIRSILTDIFEKQVMSTTNVLECVARGCAIQGAMLSPTTRLAKDFEVVDIVIHPVDIGYDTSGAMTDVNETEKRLTIFKRGEDLSQVFKMTFKRNHDFELVGLYHDSESLPPNSSAVIGKFQIKGVPQKEEKTPVKVRIGHDLWGRFTVDEAWWEEKIEYEEEKKVEMTEEEQKKEADAMKDEEKADEEKTDAKEGENTADGDAAKKEEKKPEKKYKIVREKKTRVQKHKLQVVDFVPQLSQEEISKLSKEEQSMAHRDHSVAATNEAKNLLESYAYETMDKLYEGGELYDYIEANTRDQFSNDLQEVVDWLYDEGENQTKEVYDKKLQALKAVGVPASRRAQEAEKRPTLAQKLRSKITQYREFTTNQEEQYAHIDEVERAKVSSKSDEIENWLASEESEQNKLPKFQDPSLTTDLLKQKIKELDNFVIPIMTKPKPAPKKEEKKPEEKKEDEKAEEEKKEEPKTEDKMDTSESV